MILGLFRARRQTGKFHRRSTGFKGISQRWFFYKILILSVSYDFNYQCFPPPRTGVRLDATADFGICEDRGEFSCFADG
jgi:hypothetical protein